MAKKNCTLRQSAITFFLHRDNNLKFSPFFYHDILRSCLKLYNEIPRSNKMTAIYTLKSAISFHKVRAKVFCR